MDKYKATISSALPRGYKWQIHLSPSVNIESDFLYQRTQSAKLAINRVAKQINIKVEIVIE